MFIASCPECGDSLTFPSGVALSSKCRCPLCTETFTLEECLSELPPMAEVLEGGETGSGLSPAYRGGAALATAPRTAAPSRAGSTATAGPRTGARAPARKVKGGNPIMQFAQIIVGGVVGISLAILIIWWVIGTDPFGLAPTVAQYAPFLVPEKFKSTSAPENPEASATNGATAPAPGNSRRPQRGVQLDGSRFATDEEQQNPQRSAPRTSLDPDAGELSPVVESGEDLFAPSGAFSSPFEEPSLEDFAPRVTELAPVESTPDASNNAEPSEPTLDPTLTEPSLDPTLSDPALEPTPEEPMVEEGAFQLKSFSPDATEADPTAADPTVAVADDPFSLVLPTATEDMPSLAAAEAEAWDAYSQYLQSENPSNEEKRKLTAAHYEQLATVAQTLAGLPPSPRSSAVIQETAAYLADRFDDSTKRRIANYYAHQRATSADFGMAGIVVAGVVADAQTDGRSAVVTLTVDEGGGEAIRRMIAVVREAQGIPEKDSRVVVYGVLHAGGRESLPESLAEEKAPIVLAGAVAEVGTPPASDPAPSETVPSEPAPTEPAPTEPTTPEPAPESEPAPSDPAPADPAPTEPSAEEPAPADPAPAEEPSTEPAPEEPSADEPAPEEPAPTEETPGEAPAEEPAPAEGGETP